jgi:hypothetical protein
MEHVDQELNILAQLAASPVSLPLPLPANSAHMATIYKMEHASPTMDLL